MQSVKVGVFISPARFAEVVFYNNIEENVISFHIPMPKLAEALQQKNDEYVYENVMFIGGPINFVQSFIDELKEIYPDIPIGQLGGRND